MSDPNRLLDDPTLSPLARSVLRSADGDHPGADSRRRVAAAIGISALSGAAASAATATAGLWWKVPLLVLGLVGAGTTAYVVTRPGPDAVATAPSTSPAVTSAEKAPAPTPDVAVAAITPPAITPPAITPPAPTPPAITPPAPTPATHPRAPRIEHAPTTPTPPPATTPATTPPSPAAPTSAPTADPTAQTPTTTDEPGATGAVDPSLGAAAQVDPRTLAAEVALLDRARDQLQHHDTAGALATLDQHARSFPGGALAAEADMLQLQATVAAGDHARALALARRFLQRFPDSPLAPRARAIVDGAPRSP